MQIFHGNFQDDDGNALSGGMCYVYGKGTTGLSSIYSDNSFSVKSNPFTLGSTADIFFYAEDGRYDIKLTKSGFDDKYWYDIQFLDGEAVKNLIDASADGVSYYWITVAARTDQADMATGEKGMMTNTASNRTAGVVGFVYIYSGAAWGYSYTMIIDGSEITSLGVSDGGTIGDPAGPRWQFDKSAGKMILLTGSDLEVVDNLTVDTINEHTAAAGVTIDGVLLKDSEVTTDVINEKIGAAGVTIDSCLLKDGNFVPASGKGMSFDPFAAGNLLDDYEQGTFTPAYSTTGTDYTSIAYDSITGGVYCKIGNLVFFSIRLRTDSVTVGSASGNLIITGLPFTSIPYGGDARYGDQAVSLAMSATFDTNHPSSGNVPANSTLIDLYYRATVNGETTAVDFRDLAIGANSNTLMIAGSYIAV